MKPQTRHLGLGLIFVLVVAALAWVSFREEAVPVDTAPVRLAPMRVTVDAEGKTRIREPYEIASPIAGTARRSPVRVGDPVEAGKTMVAQVEPAAPGLLDSRSRLEAQAAVREAEAGLRLAESQARQADEELAYARSQRDRIATLVQRGAASATQLEDAAQQLAIRLAAREAAQSGVAMATSSLARARAALLEPGDLKEAADLCCVTLRAPIDGVVLSVPSVSERPVAPGTLLVTLGRPDDLEIVADLLSSEAVQLVPGAPADVERWGGPGLLSATLRKVDPAARTKVSALGIEEQRVDAVFDLTSPPEDRPGLGDGFAVYLRVRLWESPAALQVPLSALFRQGEGWAVFREDGGRAELVTVTVGHRNGLTAEITSGLSEGDVVITHPSDKVADGVMIAERGAGG